MKIFFSEIVKHRNETTFRPYFAARKALLSRGVEIVTDSHSADLVMVGQASILDKTLPLQQSVDKGLQFLKQIDKPFIIVDGQDSSSLIGIWDLVKNYNNLKVIKNVILGSFADYKTKSPNGRWFWGEDICGYSVSDTDYLKENLLLSGVNWLNTYGNKFQFNKINRDKKYDVAILIGLSRENYEHGIRTDEYYNKSRVNLFKAASNLKCKVITTEKTGKLNREEYLYVLNHSKFCVSPFGFGEINIREIEALMMGTVIIKPSISKIITKPWIYGDGLSFECKSDYSDLVEIVEKNLPIYYNFAEDVLYEQYKSFQSQASDEAIAEHFVVNVLSKL